MSKRKPDLYFHQPTGNIMHATKKQAKRLPADWHLIQFIENEQGERVMRFTFIDARGVRATVDVKDNGVKEITTDVERIAE